MANNKSKKKKQKKSQNQVHKYNQNSLQSGALFALGKELATSAYESMSSWIEVILQFFE